MSKFDSDSQKGKDYLHTHSRADIDAGEIRAIIADYETRAGEPGDASALYSVIVSAYTAGVARGIRSDRREGRA